MNFFRSTKGKKYLLYSVKTRELNIEGLQASLPETYSGFKLGLGKLIIKPNLEEISDKIRQFDAIQASISADIEKIKDPILQQKLLSDCIDVKLKMMSLASKAYEADMDDSEINGSGGQSRIEKKR